MSAETKPVVSFLYLNDIEFTHQEWLWDKLVPENEVTVFHGHGGIGKSALIAALVVRIAGGHEKFLNRPIKSGFPVLWMDGEMGKFAFKRRLTWASNALSTGAKEAKERIIFTDIRPNTLRNTDVQMAVKQRIKDTGARLMVIDSYEAVFGNGIDPTQVGEAHRTLADIGVTTLIVDHEAKPSGDGPRVRSAYGSVYKHNFARSALSLTSAKHDGKPAVIISQEKSNDGPAQSDILAVPMWNVDESESEQGTVDFQYIGPWKKIKAFKSEEERESAILSELHDGMTGPQWQLACESFIGKTVFYKRKSSLEDKGFVFEKKNRFYLAAPVESSKEAA